MENKQPDEKKDESGVSSLIKPAFSGALAARGRGRGNVLGGANRFPQLLNPAQLANSNFVPKIEEEEKKIKP